MAAEVRIREVTIFNAALLVSGKQYGSFARVAHVVRDMLRGFLAQSAVAEAAAWQ